MGLSPHFICLFEDLYWNPSDLSQPVQRVGLLQQEAHGPVYGGQLL